MENIDLFSKNKGTVKDIEDIESELVEEKVSNDFQVDWNLSIEENRRVAEYDHDPFDGRDYIGCRRTKEKIGEHEVDRGGQKMKADLIITKLKDNTPFVRLFKTEYSKKLKNGSAQLVLRYIEQNLNRNRRTITLNVQKIADEIGISRKTVYKAINELRGKDVIAKRRSIKDSYFINRYILFNGSRLGEINE